MILILLLKDILNKFKLDESKTTKMPEINTPKFIDFVSNANIKK